MIPRKPYVKKPLVWTPREQEVLDNVEGYMIRVIRDGVEMGGQTTLPGQALAAIREAKKLNPQARVMVHAYALLHGEISLAIVDEDWLMERL